MKNTIKTLRQLALGTGLVMGLVAGTASIAVADTAYIVPGNMCQSRYGDDAWHLTHNAFEADSAAYGFCPMVRHENSGTLGAVNVRVYNPTTSRLTCSLVTSNGYGGNEDYIQKYTTSTGFVSLSSDGSQLNASNAGYHCVQCYLPTDGASIEGIKYVEVP
ncbi:hypothetical protein ACFL5O_08940 [Myxococcota bacterium]